MSEKKEYKNSEIVRLIGYDDISFKRDDKEVNGRRYYFIGNATNGNSAFNFSASRIWNPSNLSLEVGRNYLVSRFFSKRFKNENLNIIEYK